MGKNSDKSWNRLLLVSCCRFVCTPIPRTALQSEHWTPHHAVIARVCRYDHLQQSLSEVGCLNGCWWVDMWMCHSISLLVLSRSCLMSCFRMNLGLVWLVSYLFLGISTSLQVILCCGVVIAGFFIGTDGEINFSLIGTIFGVMSSLFVSLNSIFTKKMIPIVESNSWKLCFYVGYYFCK